MLTALTGRSHDRAINSVPWSNGDDSGWGSWGSDSGGSSSAAGVRVTEHSATQLLAVYGSASFILDEISTLPVEVDNAQRPGWVDQPSEGLDRIAWLGQIVWSLLLPGNAYLAVLGNPANPAALDPLDPAKCSVVREKGRKVVYVSGARASVPIIHIPGRMRPGDLVGMSPVEWARQSIGLGLGALQFGADFFASDGNMPGVIELPGDANPDTMTELATQWRRKRRKGGKGLPGILKGGATWKPTGVTNEQAQFLATRKYTAAEIAGQMFLLDPSDLGIPVEGSSLTYANLEQRNTRRMQVALMPWIRRIESQLSQWIPGGDYRFDVDSRLRGNTRESYETLAVAVKNEFMTAEYASQSVLGLTPDAREGLTTVSPIWKGAANDK